MANQLCFVLRRSLCAFARVSALAFALSGISQAQSGMTSASDTALLTTIVRAAAVGAGKMQVRVDPRPLSSLGDVYETTIDNMFDIPDSVRALRTGVLRALGVEPIDAVVYAQNDKCPAPRVLVPGRDTPKSLASEYAGCPDKHYYVLAIGLPREGTAALPMGQVYDRDGCMAAIGYSAVRVISTSLGPGGAVALASDYIMRRSGPRWEVVKVVPLLWME